MALWDQLKSRLADLQGNTKTRAGQVQEQGVRQRQHGDVRAHRGRRRQHRSRSSGSGGPRGVITSNDILSVFPPDELRQKFAFYAPTG